MKTQDRNDDLVLFIWVCVHCKICDLKKSYFKQGIFIRTIVGCVSPIYLCKTINFTSYNC